MALNTETNSNNESTRSTSTTGGLKFHEIVETDQKKVPVVSSASLALKLAVVVPIYTLVILPLTVTYIAGTAALSRVKSMVSSSSSSSSPETETRTREEAAATASASISFPDDFVARPDRKYDVVVLGATGFTGGLAVRHLAKTYGADNSNSKNNDKGVKWAIAGRSLPKLKSVLSKIGDDLGIPDLESAVDCIVCDTSDPSTLPSLVRDTRSVATTAGPFSLYGEPVVAACAKYGTHYADITGETSFVKTMVAKHRETAKFTGARILSLCGNDCVPWDLSYNLLADKFRGANNGNSNKETLERVEFYNEFLSSASGGTLKTMCMGLRGGLSKAPDDKILRKIVGSDKEHSEEMSNECKPFIKSSVRKPWTYDGDDNNNNDNASDDDLLVEAPFVMSGVNYEAVGWSHALRRDAKCSYKEMQLVPDYSTALDGVASLLVFFTALANPLTGRLFENYLLTQPGEGPGMKEMTDDFFLALTGTAYGSNGSVYQSLLYFDKDPGYLETARMLTECALCLALEEEAVSEQLLSGEAIQDPSEGGFFTPGFALRDSLLKRLVDTGCKYEFRVLKEAEEQQQ